jgi:hypothetical protein
MTFTTSQNARCCLEETDSSILTTNFPKMRSSEVMHRMILLAGLVVLATFACAQTAQKPESLKPTTAAPSASELPTQATVESFLQHTVGYDSNIQWQVLSIKPSPVQHVAEVVVSLKVPEGPAIWRLFVMPDQNWAIAGEIMRFGADPFAFNNRELAARAHGPSRGSAAAKITLVEFSDLQCPA